MEERRIPAGEFKAHCLRLIDEVAESRLPLVITRHGKPVARLMPIDDVAAPIFGSLAGSAKVMGDLTAALEENWDAAMPTRDVKL